MLFPNFAFIPPEEHATLREAHEDLQSDVEGLKARNLALATINEDLKANRDLFAEAMTLLEANNRWLTEENVRLAEAMKGIRAIVSDSLEEPEDPPAAPVAKTPIAVAQPQTLGELALFVQKFAQPRGCPQTDMRQPMGLGRPLKR